MNSNPHTPHSPLNNRRAVLVQMGWRLGLGLCAGPAVALAPSHSWAARPSPVAVSPLPIPLAMEARGDIDPAGYLVSEKYDGVRAVWDGRTLRFRSGIEIQAPAWFLQKLPEQPLDGELWLGRGRFERLSGTVRSQSPQDAAWQALRYMVFDAPAAPGGLEQRTRLLGQMVKVQAWSALVAVPQQRLANREALHALFNTVVSGGGEGLMLRSADSAYRAGRSRDMLKLKPLSDAEATVLAHQSGKGRLQGQLGALRVRSEEGVVFDIGTGFTDAERANAPAIGSRITYSYQGTTADGVPRFARFVRERSAGI